MAIGTAAAIIGGSIIAGGASILGAKGAASAQESAAATASGATLQAQRESIAFQERQFDQARADLAPWRQVGERALGTLEEKITAGPGKFETSPGYQFRVAEGQKAVERGAAARGGVLSGRAGKELTRFGQGVATQDYDNFLRRYYESLTPLQSLAGVGQSTASQTAGQAANLGVNVGSSIERSGQIVGQNAILAGQAGAAEQINIANTVSGGVDSGINNYLAWKYANPGVTAPATANPIPSGAFNPALLAR